MSVGGKIDKTSTDITMMNLFPDIVRQVLLSSDARYKHNAAHMHSALNKKKPERNLEFVRRLFLKAQALPKNHWL